MNFYQRNASYVSGTDPDFMEWLGVKPVEWHQRLYSLLYDHARGLEGRANCRWSSRCRDLQIVRLGDGSYSIGNNCYFPSDGIEHDAMLPRVDAGVYKSGKNKRQQENAEAFLKELGVRDVTEVEQVENILRQRYSYGAEDPDDEIYLSDLRRFVALIEMEPAKGSIFSYYRIFKDAHVATGSHLIRYFSIHRIRIQVLPSITMHSVKTRRECALSPWYKSCEIPVKQIARFAKEVGVQTQLKVAEAHCRWNPEWEYLDQVPGKGRPNHPLVDQDWSIEALGRLLEPPSVPLSRLVWRTMRELPDDRLKACYQKVESKGCRTADSQLVHLLRQAKWIPQKDGNSVVFVQPCEAQRGLLLEGFPYDEGDRWLKAISFGKNERHQSEEDKKMQANARELGFPDDTALRDAEQFAKLPPERRRLLLDEHERKSQLDLPKHNPRNPDSRRLVPEARKPSRDTRASGRFLST